MSIEKYEKPEIKIEVLEPGILLCAGSPGAPINGSPAIG
jgi:hypothetical protein